MRARVCACVLLCEDVPTLARCSALILGPMSRRVLQNCGAALVHWCSPTTTTTTTTSGRLNFSETPSFSRLPHVLRGPARRTVAFCWASDGFLRLSARVFVCLSACSSFVHYDDTLFTFIGRVMFSNAGIQLKLVHLSCLCRSVFVERRHSFQTGSSINGADSLWGIEAKR